MFDIGWQELLVIGVVALLVIGPKDMPAAIRAVSRWAAKARALAREFQQGIDEVVREADLQDVRKQIQSLESTDAKSEIAKVVDPTGELAKDLDLSGIEKSLDSSARALTHESSAGSTTPAASSSAAPAEPAPTPAAGESPRQNDSPAAKPTGTG
ncbi:MAG: twin-arginine translocase subunit TatB [Acidimicrobiia bacterium]|nr:twin-arginine translocase subunit TatB [Acidimicrobiia bacterium]